MSLSVDTHAVSITIEMQVLLSQTKTFNLKSDSEKKKYIYIIL